MSDFNQWAARYPQAAAELHNMLGAVPWPANEGTEGKSEAWAQQQVRFQVAQAGGLAWRNNVGATPARCKHCGEKQQPIRYGLANDSQKLNQSIKSHDLICIIPRRIRQVDVGRTIGQFGSIEVKPPGWEFKGAGREEGQASWGALVRSKGGYATFSTGELEL